MPLRTDRLIIPQGASWEVRWPVQNPDGTPADLSDWAPRAQIRGRVTSTLPLYTWTSDDLTIIGNSVSMKTLPEVTSTWEWRTAVFDVELVHMIDGRVVRISQGEVLLDPEVTR